MIVKNNKRLRKGVGLANACLDFFPIFAFIRVGKGLLINGLKSSNTILVLVKRILVVYQMYQIIGYFYLNDFASTTSTENLGSSYKKRGLLVKVGKNLRSDRNAAPWRGAY